jgi:DNA polymerase III subunit delta
LKLPLTQLSPHLKRGLAGIYLIAADEPLLVAEATDEIRRSAIGRGFDERTVHFVERGFRWDSLANGSDSLSLFSSKQIVELRMAAPRPGDAGAKAIRALADAGDSDRLVIISIQSKLDANASKSVWVKTIEKQGVVVDIRPVSRRDLPGFIARRAKIYGLTISTDAAELLAERVEGNLLAADQDLAKLALIRDDGHVDTQAVQESVASSARFDVFRLSDAVVAGDLERAIRVLDGLKSEGVAPALVIWALAREIALLSQLKHGTRKGRSPAELMTRLRVWQSRQSAISRALARYSDAELGRLLRRAETVDRTVKGLDSAPVWPAITGLVLDLLAPASHRLSA